LTRKSCYSREEDEFKKAIENVLASTIPKRLIIAGPGTGKTTLFKRILKLARGDRNDRIVLTFINNLRDDLEKDLGRLAKVRTLHSYCLDLLRSNPALRNPLSEEFRCCPGLVLAAMKMIPNPAMVESEGKGSFLMAAAI